MKLVNIRMDEDLKKEMEIVCNDLGINVGGILVASA